MKYLGLPILLPYIFGFSLQDTSYSEIEYGAGGGQYTYSDCSGPHSRDYIDAGVRYTHKFDSPWRAGGSASLLPMNDGSEFFFIYPDLAFDNGNVSFGTTGLRLGQLNETYFEIKGLDEVPFASGRGFLRLGLGTPVADNGTRLWFGTNGLPYQGWGLAAGAEWPYETNKFIFVNFRYGEY